MHWEVEVHTIPTTADREKRKSNSIMFNHIFKLITKIRFSNNFLKCMDKIGFKYRF